MVEEVAGVEPGGQVHGWPQMTDDWSRFYRGSDCRIKWVLWRGCILRRESKGVGRVNV